MSETTGKAAHNQLSIPLDAGEYMNSLGGEIVSPIMTIGWAELAKNPETNVPSQDAIYVYVDQGSGNGRFGLFDGAGGHAKGREAALAGRQELHEGSLNSVSPATDAISSIQQTFDNMAGRVNADAYGGITTASIGLLNMVDGKPRFEWGAVGDSPIFLIRRNTIVQLNEEETVRQRWLNEGAPEAFADRAGGTLTKALGTSIDRKQQAIDMYSGLQQHGRIDIEEGDVIVFVSDGITGDKADQRLPGGNNQETILSIMSQLNMSPREKADILLRIARKHDDRSVMVIEFSKKSKTKAAPTGDEDTIDYNPQTPLPPRAPRRLGQAVVNSLGN